MSYPGQQPPGQQPMFDPMQYLALLQAASSNPQAYNPQAATAISQLLAAQGGPGPLYMAQQQGPMMPLYSSAPAFLGQSGLMMAPGGAALVQGGDQGPRAQHPAAQGRPAIRKRKARSSDADEIAAAAMAAATAGQGLEAADEEGEEKFEGEGEPGRPLAVDRRAAALDLLKQTGVPQDRAERALQETEEQCVDFDPAGWADEAQVWLACNAEFEDERDRLAEAMQVSLEEAEQRKAQQAPLEERSAQDIAQAFSDSPLLRTLRPLCSPAALLQPPLKQALVRYLQLERRCGKWYRLSCHYFRQAAAECAEQLAAACGQRAGGRSGGGGGAGAAAAGGAEEEAVPVAAAEGLRGGGSRRSSRRSSPVEGEQEGGEAAAAQPAPRGPRTSKAARRTGRQQQLQQEQEQEEGRAGAGGGGSWSPAEPEPCGEGGEGDATVDDEAGPVPPLPAPAVQVMVAFVSGRCEAVEREVYAMPSGDGPAAVPLLFVKAAEGAEEEEEEFVDLLD